MSTLMRWYPGDEAVEFMLVVMLVVTLASSAGWLISRRLAGRVALRHLVLLSALNCCLVTPALAWLCAAADVTIVTIPLLGTRADVDVVALRETDRDVMPPREVIIAPPVAEAAHWSETNTLLEQRAGLAATPVADESPTTSRAKTRAVSQLAVRPAREPLSYPGIVMGVMSIWLAGAFLLLIRLAVHCGFVVWLRRSSRPLRDDRYVTLLGEAARQLGVRQEPLLLVSRRFLVPLAVGFGAPAVILPQRLLGALSDDELRDILMHEMAHLQRGDQWIVLLQGLAGAIYWPIVPLHGLNHELRRAREELCDNAVLEYRRAISYGETLLHVAELVVRARTVRAAMGMLGGRSELHQRIAGLIDPGRDTMRVVSHKMMCLVMCLFMTGALITSTTRFVASAAAMETPLRRPQGIAAAPAMPAVDPAEVLHAGHFSGRVTGPDGRPLHGARVFLVPYTAPHHRFLIAGMAEGGTLLLNPLDSIGPIRDVTDAEGRFVFYAPEMASTTPRGLPLRRRGLLMATAEGFAPDWIERVGPRWDPINGEDLDLQLAEIGPTVRGQLLDPDGKPLVNAKVQIVNIRVPEERDLDAHLKQVTSPEGVLGMLDYDRVLHQPDLIPRLPVETQTDADGRFTFAGLGRDWLITLRVSEPSVVTTHLTVVTRETPNINLLVDQYATGKVIYGAKFARELEPGRRVEGRVVDSASGEPIAGMWVGPIQNYRAGIWPRLYPWVTDEGGRFTITGLPPKLSQEMVLAAAPPGVPYQTAGAWITGKKELVIKSRRGIPFRLKVVDEQGQPVEADVVYVDVQPNPHAKPLIPLERRPHPLNAPAARIADGTYEGFVMPGPGAVLVSTSSEAVHRPAYVEPKAFFAPGFVGWTEDNDWAYGTDDTLTTSNEGERLRQRDYEAIVLVNPAPGSGPLELSAKVLQDRPREVHFVGPAGERMQDITWTRHGSEGYDHTLPLRRLHPERVRPLTYYQEDRRLIGTLLARGDGNAPYTVRMEPWGSVTGRVVNARGEPLSGVSISVEGEHPADAARVISATTDEQGRFHISKLIPGQRYSAELHRGRHHLRDRLVPLFAGVAFDELELRPGEVRALGDIRAKPPIYEGFPLTYSTVP